MRKRSAAVGVAVSVAVALVCLAPGCGSAAPTAPSAGSLAPPSKAASSAASSASAAPSHAAKFVPQIAALISQAAKEGHLNLSWSASGFGNNGKALPQWFNEFNRFYGLHLTYSFAPAPSMGQQAASLVQETKADASAMSDLSILGADFLLPVIEAHAARPYDWSALAKDVGVNLPAAGVAPGNAAVAFSSEVFGISYNKNAVPAAQVPNTLADVLTPRWKGKIASTPYAAGFNFLATFDKQWGPAKTKTFVTDLSRQIGGLIRCGDSAPLLDGQYDMLVLECDISSVILDQRQGQPMGYVVPTDAPIIDYWYFTVPKTSQDPAAAALFALFMLTKQGQALSWSTDANDLALLPGSHTRSLLPPGNPTDIAGGLGAQGFVQHPESLAYTNTYIKILSSAAH